MAEERLDRHGSEVARRLFDENTAQVGALGDIVEDHAGDAVIFVSEPSIGGADAGIADFESEMNPIDPSAEWETLEDEYPGTNAEDREGIGETDITGTAAGIARGFGSHLTQDLGKDGFQIEEIPDRALKLMGHPAAEEELDDYDDDDPNNGKYDSKSLGRLSEPGRSPAQVDEVGQTGRIETHDARAITFDEDLDESMREK